MLSFRLLFRISCSLSGTPISFLLISFGQFGQEFPSSSDSKFSSAHVFPLLTHQTQWVEDSVKTQSPVRAEASVMIFSKFPSSSDSKFSSAHVFPRLTHQTHSPVRVEASFMIFTNLPSSVSDFPLSVGNSDKLSSGQFGGERFGLKVLSGSEPPS